MKQIEIPYIKDRDFIYRLFEMLPGLMSWGILALPVILSFINPTYAAYFIIAYLIMWFLKTMVMNFRMAQGYKELNRNMSINWYDYAKELNNPEAVSLKYSQDNAPGWHYRNMIRYQAHIASRAKLEQIEHAVIIAVYNETIDTVGPSIESVTKSNYPLNKITLTIALEERGGKDTYQQMKQLQKKYKSKFKDFKIFVHPADMPGEVIGKGGNITYAGRHINEYYMSKGIDPSHVLVTTLDSDNRPHDQYFGAISYAYLACPDHIKASYQPIAIFTNNIWDVPAPMRVVATANSFWNIVQSLRPHMIRNFASHSQTLKTLQDTDFWSVRTIVEDGHQFWRTYFKYDGKNEVYPILLPVYQDAVLSHTYLKTLKAQFIQIRRWAWGASDIAYVLQTGWRRKNKVPKLDLFFKTSRLIESHTSWATAPLVILLGAFVPLYLAPDAGESFAANELPIIASWIQRVAMIGLFLSIYLSIKLLPPKPARYKNHFWLFILLQWMLLPLITVGYSAFSALNSQTRLILGRYLGKFDLTEKVVKKDN